MSEFLNRYCKDNIEYPLGDVMPEHILPYGVMWEYVSSTFINGFLNPGKLIGASMLNRYHLMDERFDPETASMISPTGYMNWVTVSYKTKQEYLDWWSKGYTQFHTKLNDFRDDILLLKKYEHLHDDATAYMFIWCDCDVSDCSILRFQTDDPEETVIQFFHEYANSRSLQYAGDEEDQFNRLAVKLDLNMFKGWLSF